MKQKTIDRVAWGTVFLIGFLIVCLSVLLGWAFVEIIQWLTSK